MLDAGGVRGARGILINITGSSALGLHEVNEACSLIRAAAENEDVQINFGVVLNEEAGDEVKITVIATGFERESLPAIHRRATAEAAAASAPAYPLREMEEPAPQVNSGLPINADQPEPALAAAAAASAGPSPASAAEAVQAAPAPREEPAAAAPAQTAAAPLVNGHEPLFDELDVPAILRRRHIH